MVYNERISLFYILLSAPAVFITFLSCFFFLAWFILGRTGSSPTSQSEPPNSNWPMKGYASSFSLSSSETEPTGTGTRIHLFLTIPLLFLTYNRFLYDLILFGSQLKYVSSTLTLHLHYKAFVVWRLWPSDWMYNRRNFIACEHVISV